MMRPRPPIRDGRQPFDELSPFTERGSPEGDNKEVQIAGRTKAAHHGRAVQVGALDLLPKHGLDNVEDGRNLSGRDS